MKVSFCSKNFVYREVINNSEKEVPLIDRHYALQILLELAIQQGTITAVLDMVLLLLTMSEKNNSIPDNR